MREIRNTYKILAGKPGENRLFQRPRRRWKDNIEMNVKEVRCQVVDWIHVA
jgi:hypothetical protein